MTGLIQEAWVSFAEEVLSGAPPEYLEQMRCAFFAGAAACGGALGQESGSPAGMVVRLVALAEECSEFARDVSRVARRFAQ